LPSHFPLVVVCCDCAAAGPANTFPPVNHHTQILILGPAEELEMDSDTPLLASPSFTATPGSRALALAIEETFQEMQYRKVCLWRTSDFVFVLLLSCCRTTDAEEPIRHNPHSFTHSLTHALTLIFFCPMKPWTMQLIRRLRGTYEDDKPWTMFWVGLTILLVFGMGK
jgi:hypothetical protein